MPAAILIPGPLQPFASGLRRVELPARTVREALEQLQSRHPGIVGRVLTERGEVRPHVNIFVGAENIRDARGLDTPVGEGVEIAILPAVSGG